MDDLLAARLQMAISLGFHIIFACVGMVMPFLMSYAHFKWLRTKKDVYLDLTKAWAKGTAIFFAVGAVSGTLLSFELGLLWPVFMEKAGPIFGLPFSWEGTAFFLEAIFLGIFLYGWNRISPWMHWTCGLLVGIAGVASGILVVAANAWMNAPAGFDIVDGEFVNIDPVAAFFNAAWLSQSFHMTIAAFEATGFAVAGIHAILLIRDPKNTFHRKAVKIALMFGALAAIIQPISGDFSAKDIAKRQPIKLASMESHFHTQTHAPLVIGGIPNLKTKTVDYAIEIPSLLSFLAHGSFDAEVKGLSEFPEADWPPITIVHIAFQVMVGIGTLLAFISVIFLVQTFRKKDILQSRWFLSLLSILTPAGMIALEAGWVVTEVGRQPWIIYGIMKTSDSLTPMPGLQYSLIFYVMMYLALSVIVIWLMSRQIKVAAKNYPSAVRNK